MPGPITPTKALSIGAATATVAGVLLSLVASPGLTWRDAGELGAAAWELGIAHPPGFPGFCLLHKAVMLMLPVGDAAFRGNLASTLVGAIALGGAAAAGNAFGLRATTAAAGALLAGFTGIFVLHATRIEVYTGAAAWTTLCLVAAARLSFGRDDRWAVALALLVGLAAAHHAELRLLAFPMIILWVPTIRARRWRGAVVVTGAGVLGAFCVAYLPLRSAAGPWRDWGHPATAAGFWDHISGARIRLAFEEQIGHIRVDALADYALQLFDHAPGLLLMGTCGMVLLLRRPGGWVPAVFWVTDTIYSTIINPMGLEGLQNGVPGIVVLGLGSAALLDRIIGVGAAPRPRDGLASGLDAPTGAQSAQRSDPESGSDPAAHAECPIGSSAQHESSVVLVRPPRSRASDRWRRFRRARAGIALGLILITSIAAAPAVRQVISPPMSSPAAALLRAVTRRAPPESVALVASDDFAAGLAFSQVVEGARPDMAVIVRQHDWDRSSVKPTLRRLPYALEGWSPDRGLASLKVLRARGGTLPIIWEWARGRDQAFRPPILRPVFPLFIADGSEVAPDRFEDELTAWRGRLGGQAAVDRGNRRVTAGLLTDVGLHRLDAGQPPSAVVSAFKHALALWPRSAATRTNLGVALALAGDPDAAVDMTRAALALAPRDPRARRNLARFLLQRGDDAAAYAVLTDLLNDRNTDAEGLALRGIVHARAQRYEQAFLDFSSALRADPAQSEALTGIDQLVRIPQRPSADPRAADDAGRLEDR